MESNITTDFAEAWQTLNADLIVKHLSPDFIYDSQWAFESLNCQRYIEYIQGKFKTLKEHLSQIDAQIVLNSEEKGIIRIQQDKGEPVFYVIQIKNGKTIKGDLCMFI